MADQEDNLGKIDYTRAGDNEDLGYWVKVPENQ